MALTRPKYSQIFDSDFKNSARVATTTSVTLTGGAPTVVDDVTLVLGNRVLVRSQANSAQNGIYRVNTLGTGSNGTWGRSQDASTADRLTPGTTLSVEEGTTLGGKLFRMTSVNPITLGVTAITWTDVSGGGGSASGNNGQIQYNDVNAFGGATYLYYNKTTGQVTANADVVSTSTTTGTFIVTGGAGISGALNVGANVTVTGNVLPSANVTYNLGSPTQRWKDLYLAGNTINLSGATISATNGAITFQNSLGGSFSVTGSASGQSTGTFGNIIANSGVASSSTSTGALIVTGGVGVSGAVNIGGALTVTGNLTVNGTTTNINTTNLVIEDKNIVLADVTTPTDTTADGAGITVKGATDKTFNWINSTAAWTSSEDLNLLTGKQYEIAGTSVLTATTLGSGVVNSSLTSLGTVASLVATAGRITTEVATNFSTANAVITGGSLNNTTIGATTHTTGRFTTVTATTVNAGTIGNTSATLTGTLSTAAQTNITSVGTLGALAVTGNTTSGNFIGTHFGSGAALTTLNATNISSGTLAQARLANAAVTLGSTALTLGATVTTVAGLSSVTSTTFVGALTGAATTAGTVTTAAQPNITSVGTLTGLTVSGAIVPNANLTSNIGSVSTWFNTFFGVSTQARYADLAENYQADSQYEPGTVLVFGGTQEVTTTDQDHNTAVAGIVSTNPAHLMNGMLVGNGVVALGLTGRLPCRVQGPVAKGDVLVTGTVPGVAQRIDNSKFLPGCVVGKALETINTNNIQTIEVVVGRF